MNVEVEEFSEDFDLMSEIVDKLPECQSYVLVIQKGTDETVSKTTYNKGELYNKIIENKELIPNMVIEPITDSRVKNYVFMFDQYKKLKGIPKMTQVKYVH